MNEREEERLLHSPLGTGKHRLILVPKPVLLFTLNEIEKAERCRAQGVKCLGED